MSDTVEITKLALPAPSADFEACAQIHKEAISEGFLATLNLKVLECIYRAAANSPHAFIYIAHRNGEVIGFICGALDTGRFYRSCIFRHFTTLAWYMLPALISWKRIYRIIETLLYPARRQSGPDLPTPEILNFCVTESARAHGVGAGLFSALVAEFRSRNIPAISIVTGQSQTTAISFYKARGAELAQEIEIHKDVKSFIYVYQI